MSGTQVYSLNVHATYACRRSGACCTAGWSIPVEPRLREVVGREWIVPLDNGACPEFDSLTRACRLHQALGEDALPESCFQFPRRALLDARGTFITLSHFCPTAAALLVDAADTVRIVEDPQAFPRERRYEGLDARHEWPPVVRPHVLFDLASYARWEQFVVAALGEADGSAMDALARVAWAAERLREWTPDHGPLQTWIESALGHANRAPLPRFYDFCTGADAYELARACVPGSLTAPPPTETLDLRDTSCTVTNDRCRRAVLRYVASKAIGAWSAYDGHGVRTQVAELLLSSAVLQIECARACEGVSRTLDRSRLIQAVRAADWLLIHLVDRPALMARLREVEAHAPARLES